MASSVSEQVQLNPVLLIGYPSQLDGTILPARDYPHVLREHSVLLSYHKSFIDQAYKVKIAGYWPHSFLGGVFIDREGVKTLSSPRLYSV